MDLKTALAKRVRGWALISGCVVSAITASFVSSQSAAQCSQLGVSGGNVHDANGEFCCAGTLGALLSDGKKQYVLSNNHVLGLIGRASAGDEISQPGLRDNYCKPGRTVAKLTLSLPLAQSSAGTQFDAAIAEVVAGQVDPQGTIVNLGIPGSLIVAPSKHLRVTKMGPSSGVTTGVIDQTVVNANIDYSSPCSPEPVSISLTNLILIKGDNSKPFSLAGDSGSLVMTATAHNPVGLLIAGNDLGQSLAHPIAPVLKSLSAALKQNVSVVSTQPNAFTARAQSLGVISPEYKKLLDAKDLLWAKVHALPEVVAVGVEPRPDNPAFFQLVIYVERGKLSALAGERLFGFQVPGEPTSNMSVGHLVRLVEADRFKAY
jgi:hypothetical protein